MKICVLSDSHGNRDKVEQLFKDNQFDLFFFLGDGLRDIVYVDCPRKVVEGNCDWFSDEALVQTFNIDKYKFLITHGHKFYVKTTLQSLLETAKNQRVDVVCYGHTHIQKIEKIDGIYFLNPGAFKNGNYAVINIENNELNIKLLCC